MTVIVKHNKTNTITDWTQAQLNEQIALGNFAPGTTLANIVLPSDWNNDHTLTGVGTMAEQNANSVAITGGSVNGTTIGATTASTGRFSDLTDTGLTSGRVTYATTGGNLTDSANLTFNGTTLTTTAVTTPSVTATTTNLNLYPASTGNVIVNQSSGGAFGLTLAQDISTPTNSARLFFDSNVNVASIRNNAGGGLAISTGATIGSTSGAIQFQASPTTSAVNYVQVTGAATTAKPVISAQGSDANITLALSGKGGGVQLYQNGTSSPLMFEAVAIGSAVNYFRASPSITAQAVPLSAQGTDTNISMAFQPKGTGAIDLAAGSSGVNISNGGTVTATTRTAAGSGYTSIPSVAITAPTTAGGVQAVLAAGAVFTNAVSINNGGTGYTVGNVLTVVGGTPETTAAQITVTSVSGGVITGATVSGVNYSVMPPVPASVTGGSGLSATFTISGVSQGATITNAGSGYIEQPTVTFSGGGGSGAAAYASVGSQTIIKGIGASTGTVSNQSIMFQTPSGNSFLLRDAGTATPDAHIMTQATANGYALFMAEGSNANSSLYVGAKGSGSVRFNTNSTSLTEQMRVSHTASAVNYVQVTGAATAGRPTISSQGSDTNIDLALTPKGTGNVRFGTYTGTILTPTGFIEIKDSGGTTRRLLVG